MIKLDICKARMANIVNITIKTKTKAKISKHIQIYERII